MPDYTSLPSLFSDIADAIRAKTGDTAQIVADDFPTAIGAISAGVALAPAKTASGGGATTLSFSGLLAEPKFFVVFANDFSESRNTYTVAFVLYDGTDFTGGTIYYRSDVGSWGNASFSKAWNNNTKTLTITVTSSSRKFASGTTYTLLYAY